MRHFASDTLLRMASYCRRCPQSNTTRPLSSFCDALSFKACASVAFAHTSVWHRTLLSHAAGHGRKSQPTQLRAISSDGGAGALVRVPLVQHTAAGVAYMVGVAGHKG